jgi:hypothetical protein
MLVVEAVVVKVAVLEMLDALSDLELVAVLTLVAVGVGVKV